MWPNHIKPIIEYEAIQPAAQKSWRPDVVLAGIVGTIAAANLIVAVSAWPDYHTFATFAVAWFCLGVASIAACFCGCRWASVFVALTLSAAGFCINAHFLTEITASC